jgi:transcription antitermination protein NusB
MQMLYQWELGRSTPEQVSAAFFSERKAHVEVENFARELFLGVVGDIDRVDYLVRRHAENWRLGRMAAVDRSILRVAVYELLHCPGTPPHAVINEALEVARRFSGDGAVEFINGILDSVMKSLPAGEAKS